MNGWDFHQIFTRNSWEWNGMSSSQLTFTPSFFRGVGQPPTRYVMVCWCWPVLGQTEMGMGWVSSTPQNWAKIAHDYSAIFIYSSSIFWVSFRCSQGTGGFDSSAQWLTDPPECFVGDHWQRLDKVDTPFCKHCPVQRTVCDSIHLQ